MRLLRLAAVLFAETMAAALSAMALAHAVIEGMWALAFIAGLLFSVAVIVVGVSAVVLIEATKG
jgi:hypothetical protein